MLSKLAGPSVYMVYPGTKLNVFLSASSRLTHTPNLGVQLIVEWIKSLAIYCSFPVDFTICFFPSFSILLHIKLMPLLNSLQYLLVLVLGVQKELNAH